MKKLAFDSDKEKKLLKPHKNILRFNPESHWARLSSIKPRTTAGHARLGCFYVTVEAEFELRFRLRERLKLSLS